MAFGIRPHHVEPRFGLGVGALFAVSASEFVVASVLPDSAPLTLADQVHVISMGFILASIAQSVYVLKLDDAGAKATWILYDRLCLVLFPAAFLIWIGWLIHGTT